MADGMTLDAFPAVTGHGASLTQVRPAVCYVLRCRPASIGHVAGALGFGHAGEPLRAQAAGSRTMLHLGPDEWWFLVPESDRAVFMADIATALDGIAHSLVDSTDRQIGFLLKGAEAACVLQAFCPLDLHDTVFPISACTRTILAKSDMLLWRTGQTDYLIAIARSFAAYAYGHLSNEIATLNPIQE